MDRYDARLPRASLPGRRRFAARLLATGALADVELPDGAKAGQTVKTTLFPITMDGARLPVRLQPPKRGAHSQDLLRSLGYDDAGIEALRRSAAVA